VSSRRPFVAHGVDSGRCCRCCRCSRCSLRRPKGGAAERKHERLRVLPRAAGIRSSGRHDHVPFRTLDHDELGVDDGTPSWQRSRLDPVGPRAERPATDTPAEAHPVHTGMPGNTEPADSPALGRYLGDHELDGSGTPEAEDEHRLPATPGTRARDPVAREVQPRDVRPTRPRLPSGGLAAGAGAGPAGRRGCAPAACAERQRRLSAGTSGSRHRRRPDRNARSLRRDRWNSRRLWRDRGRLRKTGRRWHVRQLGERGKSRRRRERRAETGSDGGKPAGEEPHDKKGGQKDAVPQDGFHRFLRRLARRKLAFCSNGVDGRRNREATSKSALCGSLRKKSQRDPGSDTPKSSP